MLVVVRFDHQMVRRTDIRLHLFVRTAAVGHQHKTLPLVVDAVTQTVGRVMFDMKRVDAHAEQVPFFAAFKEASAGAQFFTHTVVAVDTFVYSSGGVDWQFDAFAECAYRTDMIGMVVGDEHTHDVGKVESHLAQTLLYLARRDARINQDALLTRAEVVTVTAATTRKTPKYETFTFHLYLFLCK